jgi:hypothetical protein
MRLLWFAVVTIVWLGPSLIYVHEEGWRAAAWTFWVGPLVAYPVFFVVTMLLVRLMDPPR